jgi:Ran GTPase-activating protein (RanGAP) involved in mRNA processing and transport
MFAPDLATNITILTLDYNNFGNAGLYQLMTYIKDSKSLIYLSLSYCGIDSDGIKNFQEFLTSADIVLEKLILQGNPLKNAGVNDLIQILYNNTSLEELNLNNTLFGNDTELMQSLVGLLQSNTKLDTYHAKFNFINDQGKIKFYLYMFYYRF